jgi:periplasmic protein CpxP/Spy
MRKQIRSLAMFTCIAAATAFGSQLAIADTGPAFDQPEVNCGQHQKGHHGPRYFKKLAKALGLTSQQKVQAKAIFENQQAQNKPLFSALMTEKHQLRTLIQSGTTDEAAIRAQAAKLSSAQADLAVQKAQAAKQFLALLTPDQVTKLRAFQAKQDLKFQKFQSHQEAPAK